LCAGDLNVIVVVVTLLVNGVGGTTASALQRLEQRRLLTRRYLGQRQLQRSRHHTEANGDLVAITCKDCSAI
jgi:hypothetical protein